MGAAIDPQWSLQQSSSKRSRAPSSSLEPWQWSHPEPILIGSSSSVAAAPTVALAGTVARKKQRAAPQPAAAPTCQVEGCNADLTGCKGYHRRHRVCEMHSKSPRSIVAGTEQRFCQQCSRFHSLAEFDEGKRSCRRRLAGHNERRRKPPQPDPFAMPIFTGSEKQHILDGTFLLNGNDGSIWPGFQKANDTRRFAGEGTAGLHFYVQNPSKQGLLALRESIATQGVYQFLRCHNATSTVAPSSGGLSLNTNNNNNVVSLMNLNSTTTNTSPQLVSMATGALSLLSQEQASAAAAASSMRMMLGKPDALLQLSSSTTSISNAPAIPTAIVRNGDPVGGPFVVKSNMHQVGSGQLSHGDITNMRNRIGNNNGNSLGNDLFRFQKPPAPV